MGVVLLCMALMGGYGLALHRRAKIEAEWIPIIVVASITNLMFAAGLLNFMPLMAYALVLLGIVLMLIELKKIKLQDGKSILSIVLFLGFAAYLIFFCRGGVYADGDTMTHWGVIAREMIEVNRLPNFTTTEVAYQSYPPGTACWIYFVCRIAGYSEEMTLLAQGVMLLAALFPLFGLVKRGNGKADIINKFIMLCVILYLLQYNNRLDSLRVDEVMSALAITGLCILKRYCCQPRKMLMLAMPIIALLSIVKNVGIFYAAIFALPMAVIYCKKSNVDWKEKCLTIAKLLILPCALAIFLWDCHIAMVYSDAAMTRHSASLTYMVTVAQSKPQSELMNILMSYIHAFFSLDQSVNASGEWVLLASFMLMMLLGYIQYKRTGQKLRMKQTVEILGAVLGFFMLYKVLLLFMYLFNMPDEDALVLGGYARYTRSVLAVIIAIMAMYVTDIIDDVAGGKREKRLQDGKVLPGRLTALMMSVCLLMYPASYTVPLEDLARPDYQEDGLYRVLKRVQTEYGLPEKDGKILVYTYTKYSRFFIHYCFRSQDVWSVAAEDFERAMTTTPGYYDYLIVTDHDESIDGLLQAYGYETDQILYELN